MYLHTCFVFNRYQSEQRHISTIKKVFNLYALGISRPMCHQEMVWRPEDVEDSTLSLGFSSREILGKHKGFEFD